MDSLREPSEETWQAAVEQEHGEDIAAVAELLQGAGVKDAGKLALAVVCLLCEREFETAMTRDLRDRMADLLTRTADALKGPPRPLCSHSWHDLPEVAKEIAISMG